MNVSDYIWSYLADQGVEHVFYLPGGGAMHLLDALARQNRIKPIAMLDERLCGWAAVHYAQARQSLGVCLVTTGPGGTNAVTPCAAAWTDYHPVLFISGQVPTTMMNDGNERQKGPQEIGILEVVKPITKLSWTWFPYCGLYCLNTVIGEALSHPRGPVWLDIPLDVQGAEVE